MIVTTHVNKIIGHINQSGTSIKTLLLYLAQILPAGCLGGKTENMNKTPPDSYNYNELIALSWVMSGHKEYVAEISCG